MFRLEQRVTLKVYVLSSAVSYFNQVNFSSFFLSQSYSGDFQVLSGHFALLLTEWRSQGPALLPEPGPLLKLWGPRCSFPALWGECSKKRSRTNDFCVWLGGRPAISICLWWRGPRDMGLSMLNLRKSLGNWDKLVTLPLLSSRIELVEELRHGIIHYSLWQILGPELITSCDLRDLLWASLTFFFLVNYLYWMGVCGFLLSLKYSPQNKEENCVYKLWRLQWLFASLCPHPVPATIT